MPPSKFSKRSRHSDNSYNQIMPDLPRDRFRIIELLGNLRQPTVQDQYVATPRSGRS